MVRDALLGGKEGMNRSMMLLTVWLGIAEGDEGRVVIGQGGIQDM
jgi:hypothetical protein